jgi:hypothetical protein
MKVKKMLSRLMDYFNADRHQQIADLKSIRKVLRKLKQKERELKSKLSDARNDEQREALKTKLDVIYAQRTKGMQMVRELRAQLRSGADADSTRVTAECAKNAAQQPMAAGAEGETQPTQPALEPASAPPADASLSNNESAR